MERSLAGDVADGVGGQLTRGQGGMDMAVALDSPVDLRVPAGLNRRVRVKPIETVSGRFKRPVVINARAAVRSEISGVERWAQEMVKRLPDLRPDSYVVASPGPRLAHKPGHLWEQGLLPARARGGVIFSPANLAPVASSRNVVVL